LTTTDAHEVFVCDGGDEHTVHVIALDAAVAGVRNTPSMILALDVRGMLYGLDPSSGQRAFTRSVGSEGLGLASTEAGRWAAVHAGGVSWGEGAQLRGVLPIAGARFAAFDGSGRGLAVVTADGSLCTVALGGSPGPLQTLGHAATGLAHSRLGWWLVSTMRGIFRIPEAGGEPELYLEWGGDAPPVGVACSHNGRVCAFTTEGKVVVLFGVERDANLGAIAYHDREPGELEFGPQAWLGIGIGLGDGNKIDLLGSGAHRTDPPPDRPRNRWMLQLGFDAKEVEAEHGPRDAVVEPDPVAAAGNPAAVVEAADPRTQWGAEPNLAERGRPTAGMLIYAAGLLVAAGLLGWTAVAGWYEDPFLAWLGVGILGISGASILAASRKG
jgi:hypothetical protein